MISVETFLTHDNIFKLQVLSKGKPVKLTSTGVYRIVVTSGTTQVDSSIDAAAFDYTTEGENGIISFDFTDLSGVPPGRYLCSLTIFDTAHPNGQVWDKMFELTVYPKVVI